MSHFVLSDVYLWQAANEYTELKMFHRASVRSSFERLIMAIFFSGFGVNSKQNRAMDQSNTILGLYLACKLPTE